MDFTCPTATAEIESEKDHELEDLVSLELTFLPQICITNNQITKLQWGSE